MLQLNRISIIPCGTGDHEQMDPRVKVKSEPVDERDQPTLMNTANTEITGIDKLAFNPEEDMGLFVAVQYCF